MEKKIVYYSLNDLNKKIEKYLDISNGFFAELGANDGVTSGQDYLFKNNIEKTP